MKSGDEENCRLVRLHEAICGVMNEQGSTVKRGRKNERKAQGGGGGERRESHRCVLVRI